MTQPIGAAERQRSAAASEYAAFIISQNLRNRLRLEEIQRRCAIVSGIFCGLFMFAPVLGVIYQFKADYLYIVGAGGALLAATLVPLLGANVRLRFTKSYLLLLLFFALATGHALSEPAILAPDLDVYQALVSVGLCVVLVGLLQVADVRWAAIGVLISLVIVGFITAVFVTFSDGYVWARIHGFSYNSENLEYLTTGAVQSAAVAPMVLYLRWRRSWTSTLFGGALLAFTIYALTNSLARTALLSGGLSFVLAMAVGYKNTGVSRVTAAFKGVLLASPIVLAALQGLAQNTFVTSKFMRMLDFYMELQKGGRGDVWRRAIDLVYAEPVSGRGVYAAQAIIGTYPHNAVLEAWIDLGLFGALAIAGIIISFFWGLAKAIFSSQSALVLAFYLAGMVYVVEALKSMSLYGSRPTLLMAVIAPVLALHVAAVEEEKTLARRWLTQQRQASEDTAPAKFSECDRPESSSNSLSASTPASGEAR